MHYPQQRGEISSALQRYLLSGGSGEDFPAAVRAAVDASEDLLEDEDVQIALFCLYELHYTGIEGVDDRLEWDPVLLSARAIIEEKLESEIRRRVTLPVRPEPSAEAVAATLFEITGAESGPSLAKYIAKKATLGQLKELLIQRSLYQLKEADPHTWAIPRLTGRAKAALVEIQADEYGNGRPELMHSALFARAMRHLDLDDSYGHYVDSIPAITVASLNTMSMFGLNRRLRAAAAGHLAAFEMTSSIPNRFYGNGFRRLGFGPETTHYFDEHIEADAVHEQIAGRDLAGALVESDPGLLDDVLFGAATCLALDAAVGMHLHEAWTNDRSSLRDAPGNPSLGAALVSSSESPHA